MLTIKIGLVFYFHINFCPPCAKGLQIPLKHGIFYFLGNVLLYQDFAFPPIYLFVDRESCRQNTIETKNNNFEID
jgi:hypothetical protein